MDCENNNSNSFTHDVATEAAKSIGDAIGDGMREARELRAYNRGQIIRAGAVITGTVIGTAAVGAMAMKTLDWIFD